MFEDTCFEYPLPTNTQIASLFRRVKNLHLHIYHSFGCDPSDWFADTSEVLLRSRGAELKGHILFLQHMQHCLQPYFRAMDITYDTYSILFVDEEVWDREAAHLKDTARKWAGDLRAILDAWDEGILHRILPSFQL